MYPSSIRTEALRLFAVHGITPQNIGTVSANTCSEVAKRVSSDLRKQFSQSEVIAFLERFSASTGGDLAPIHRCGNRARFLVRQRQLA